MGRPRGSKGRGFNSSFNRTTRTLLRKGKSPSDLKVLKGLIRDYEKLVKAALLGAVPSDTVALRRLSDGITAIARSRAAIGRIERSNELQKETKQLSNALQTILNREPRTHLTEEETPGPG